MRVSILLLERTRFRFEDDCGSHAMSWLQKSQAEQEEVEVVNLLHASERQSQRERSERGGGELLHLSQASGSKESQEGFVPHLLHANGMSSERGGGDDGDIGTLRSADSHESLLGIKRWRSHGDIPTGADSILESGIYIATRTPQRFSRSNYDFAVRRTTIPTTWQEEVSYIGVDGLRVPAASVSSQIVEEVRYIDERRVPASLICNESQQREKIVAHGRETAEVFADDGERVPASDMTRCGFTTAPQLSRSENDVSAAFVCFESGVHGYDGSVEHAMNGDDTQRILADFARFEWPSHDNTGAPPACPGLTADDSLVAGPMSLSVDSLDRFLADIESGTHALATSERDATYEDSPPLGHRSEMHDMVCKLKASGQGMRSLHPDLLQNLRVVHASWRRSISQSRLPRSDNGSSDILTKPAIIRARNSFELIDALDDAFLPTVRSHDRGS